MPLKFKIKNKDIIIYLSIILAVLLVAVIFLLRDKINLAGESAVNNQALPKPATSQELKQFSSSKLEDFEIFSDDNFKALRKNFISQRAEAEIGKRNPFEPF